MSSDRLVGTWIKGYMGDRLYACAQCGKADLTHDQTYRHALFECKPRRPDGGATKVGMDGYHLRGGPRSV